VQTLLRQPGARMKEKTAQKNICWLKSEPRLCKANCIPTITKKSTSSSLQKTNKSLYGVIRKTLHTNQLQGTMPGSASVTRRTIPSKAN
jgi:hypothetical protein